MLEQVWGSGASELTYSLNSESSSHPTRSEPWSQSGVEMKVPSEPSPVLIPHVSQMGFPSTFQDSCPLVPHSHTSDVFLSPQSFLYLGPVLSGSWAPLSLGGEAPSPRKAAQADKVLIASKATA